MRAPFVAAAAIALVGCQEPPQDHPLRYNLVCKVTETTERPLTNEVFGKPVKRTVRVSVDLAAKKFSIDGEPVESIARTDGTAVGFTSFRMKEEREDGLLTASDEIYVLDTLFNRDEYSRSAGFWTVQTGQCRRVKFKPFK